MAVDLEPMALYPEPVTVGIQESCYSQDFEEAFKNVVDQNPWSFNSMEVLVPRQHLAMAKKIREVRTGGKSHCFSIDVRAYDAKGRANSWNAIREMAGSYIIVYVDDNVWQLEEMVISRLCRDLDKHPDKKVARAIVNCSYRPRNFLMDSLNDWQERSENKGVIRSVYAMRKDIGLEMPEDVIDDHAWLTTRLEEGRVLRVYDAVALKCLPSRFAENFRYRMRREAGRGQMRRLFKQQADKLEARGEYRAEPDRAEYLYLPANCVLNFLARFYGNLCRDLGLYKDRPVSWNIW